MRQKCKIVALQLKGKGRVLRGGVELGKMGGHRDWKACWVPH